MTPISADELVFDEDGPVGGMGAVSADDLEFDAPAPKAKKKAPAQPKLKPLGELRERARTFKPLQDPAPGYELALEQEPGGVVLQFPKGDSFKAEGITVGQKAPGKIKPRLVGVRREDGESAESFRKRAEAWSQSEKARKAQERAELAQVRARTTPSRGPVGRVAEGFKTGFGETIRTAGVGASLLTGQEPDAVALEQPLPTIGTEDAKGWLSKGGQGLGSMAGFLMTSPALGPMGATLMGAAQNAGQTYEEARARGVNHDEALAAAVPGALIGALEGIGGGGGTATGFVKGTLGEAGQEGLSQVLNNINAKFLSGYDPKRAITEGVIESAVLGGFLGAGVHGVGAALTGQPPVVPTEPMAPQLAAIPKANPSFISNPTERQANLQAWHEGADPRLKGPDGQPIAVYHGTQSPAEIEQLDMSKLDPNALYGPGFYMTQDPEVAAGEEGYASTKFYTSPSDLQTEMNKIAQEYRDHGRSEEDIKTTLQIPIQQEAEDRLTQRSSPHAYKLYANIQKPFDIDGPVPGQALEKFYEELGYLPRAQDAKAFYDSLVKTLGDKAKANEWLKRAGFDGITHIGGGLARQYSKMFSSENEAQEYARKIGVSDSAIEQVIDDEGNELSQWDVKGHRVWIAFDPTQIKSATGNQGTFAKGDPRLAASLASRPVVGFRLASLEALQSPKVPEKMTPDQATAALKTVKAEEREWLGLDAVIDKARQEGRSVTKAELQQAIQDNQIELIERANKVDYDSASKLWKQTGTGKYEAPIGLGGTAIIRESPNGSTWVKYSNSVTELQFDTLEDAMFYGLPEMYRQEVGLGKGLQYANYDPWTVAVSNPREIMFQVNQGGQNIAGEYQAPHFGNEGKGLMAHARVWDGQVGGRRSLMLGEVQSDLHQAGKAKGYGGKSEIFPATSELIDSIEEIQDRAERENRELTVQESEDILQLELQMGREEDSTQSIPDTPFKQTWPDLILKRMVMYASEKGYDQIVWPRGEAHAELYYPGRTKDAPGIYTYLYDRRLPGLAKEWAKKYGAEYKLGPEGHVLRLGPKLKEIASPGGQGLPMFSFTSDQLLEMEARAAQAGRPVALRPVTVQSFHQQIGAINQELMRVDPASPEFARLADRAVQLRRAVEEAPTPADLKDGKSMREWARKQNMWHDTAAQDLLDLLGITDESGTDTSLPGIKTNWDLYHRRVKSGERGARFYPLPANNNKGGTVFLSPQSMVDAGVIEAEEVGKIGGMNVSLNIATDYARLAELGGHVDVAVAIRGAIREAQEKGLPKIALAMYVPGQGLKTTKQFLRHESFHTGQQVAANAAAPPESVGWNDPTALVSTELLYHPIVAKVARTEGGQSVLAYYDGDQSALAFEMAAYAAAKQYNELGWSKEEADEYLADYLMDVLETSGVEALEGLAKGARLSAPVAQQVAKLTEDHYGRERQRRDRASSFAASLRAPSTTVGPEDGARGSGEQDGGVGEGGVGEGGVEGKVDGVSGKPSVIDLGGMGTAIAENMRQAWRDAVTKTGKLPPQEKGTVVDQAFERLVAGGAPRDVTTLNVAIQQAEEWEARKKGTVETPIEEARDYGELDADDLEWDEDDLVDPVEQQLRDVYEKATQEVPPTPPTAPTPTDGGRPGSPLTETVVAKDRYAQLREKLMQAAVAKGYKWDLSIPPGLQLARAIKAGYLEMDNMTEVLARAGMTVTDLADLAEFTQHRAGQILNELSKITKELDDLISTNPQLASLIIGPNKVMQRGLKKLEATELGHSIWERAGSIMRKNFLSRLATAFTQVWSTTAQVPLDIASGAIAGLGMRFLNPAKWQHNTTGMLATAKEDVVRGIEPVLALARGMNPAQIADLLRWQKPAKQMEYKKIVDDLSLIYPEIYGKLHGREDIVPGSEGYTSPATLRQVLSQVKDPALRREYEVKLRTLEGREKFNKSLRGKVLKGYENALDVILMPLSIQEYAFRRPMFVGALQRELEARGLDLNDFIANPQKVAGARDMLQAAVDEALRFTWAYEPKAGNKALGQFEQALEGMGHYFIKYWNKAGPIGATLEAFPRALTNGLKFAYEWSPLGFLSPAWQAQDKMRHGARDQITFQESQRMAQAVVGTMMYAVALGLREWAGGEEWWQLKTGKKNKDGKPIYYDVRRIPQLAFFLNAADLAKRASEDTLGDIKVEQRLKDTYLGARRNSQPGDLGAIDQFMLMWTGDTVPTNAKQKSKLAAGQWASTFVIPLSNIRDAWAQFNVQEGAKRDLRESPWLGPSMDKLPWIRRKLSLAEGPFEPSPQLGAYAPLAEGEGLGPVTGAFALGGAIGATRMTPGQSFAAREFARLGLSPYTWLKRDPSPAIDRAQWKRMTTILQAVGNSLANNPGYLSQSPDQQRAIWEEIIGGPEGAAAEAKAAGLESNPQEAERRKTLQAVPPYRRKAIGLDKLIPPVGQP